MRALVLLVVVGACGRFGFTLHDGVANGDGNTSTDGGSGDGGIGDGASTGDAASFCPPTLDICDGFETGLDTTTWMADPNVTIDTTRPHRGTSSLHMYSPAFAANTNSYTLLSETQTLASGVPTFWVRGWFWLSALPAGTNGMELISAERPGSSGNYVFVFNYRTTVYTQFGNASQETATTVPIGSWFCVVFKVVRSTSTTGALEASGDIPTLAVNNVRTDAAQSMTHLTLGIGFASSNTPSAQPALELWLDDVIVHSAPVTCAD